MANIRVGGLSCILIESLSKHDFIIVHRAVGKYWFIELTNLQIVIHFMIKYKIYILNLHFINLNRKSIKYWEPCQVPSGKYKLS